MKQTTKPKALKRLARIEGQVRGVARMIEDDRYCVDVVRQIQAIRSALSSLEKLALEDHMDTCVKQALTSDDLADRKAKVEELVEIFAGRKA